ncbi:MAG: HAD family hydrolase [Planctomycetota bacterium]
MRYDAVIFDLGNTLVSYYGPDEWPAVLDECIGQVASHLRDRGLWAGELAGLSERVAAERPTPEDHAVVPLEDRLIRIFQLDGDRLDADVLPAACRRFMRPIFARARPHDDVLPLLDRLGEQGYRTGIVSNIPWGGPAILWREELDRHRLLAAVHAVVFCRDAGFRKPARQPFDLVLRALGTRPDRSLFVGDDPRWDLAGPRAIGMDAVLVDRTGRNPDAIHRLDELLDRL